MTVLGGASRRASIMRTLETGNERGGERESGRAWEKHRQIGKTGTQMRGMR